MRLFVLFVCVIFAGCAASPRAGNEAVRTGDEIVIAGRLFHTGAPVVLWTDPGGYDAYRVERRFVPWDQAGWDETSKSGAKDPARYGLRFGGAAPGASGGLAPQDLERVRGGGWDLESLQQRVDQFVLHYDVCGTSRTCFRVLHDVRGLSVHFMLDIDGTIYQTLDVKERAWHATTSNDRSVGIEIANIGAYPPTNTTLLDEWYTPDGSGRTRLTIPARLGDGGVRTPGFIGHPARNDAVRGSVQGQDLLMYDLTDEQYRSLARLTATLSRVLPRITLGYPRGSDGKLVTSHLATDVLANYHGILGHFHVQPNKIDPGPALDWERLIDEARRLVPMDAASR